MPETQGQRILQHFRNHPNEWVSGTYFNDTLHLTQYHARIHELQKKGHAIEASTFTDDYGFKSYRYSGSEPVPENRKDGCCYWFHKYGDAHSAGCPRLADNAKGLF